MRQSWERLVEREGSTDCYHVYNLGLLYIIANGAGGGGGGFVVRWKWREPLWYLTTLLTACRSTV